MRKEKEVGENRVCQNCGKEYFQSDYSILADFIMYGKDYKLCEKCIGERNDKERDKK